MTLFERKGMGMVMIKTRYDACRILGVSSFATDDQVKAAYKALVKKYHPDSNANDVSKYHQVVEAYEFLQKNKIYQKPTDATRVFGQKNNLAQKRSEKEAFDRWYENRKKEKQKELLRRMEEEKEKQRQKEQQEAEYRRAMEAINNIILAETIKAMIRSGQDLSEAKKNED